MVTIEMTAEKHDLFEDPSFTADDSALFSDYTTPLSRLTGKVTWLRPEDSIIMLPLAHSKSAGKNLRVGYEQKTTEVFIFAQQISKSPCLFPDDYADAYPKQGILGDCWLLCACTMLLKNRYLLNQVMPPGQCVWGQSGYTGQFRFQFWRNGHWTEIQIDDRLPCIKDTPCFSRCQSPMAFWVALLEKAYAKLHGSYERLWAGQVCEAVVDLSGGVAERWSLKKSLNTPGGRSVFSELSQEMRKQSYISCCVHEAPTGAPEQGQFHALSVMEWKAVKTIAGAQVQLLQIHNPWGRRCWEGAWTESAVKVSVQQKSVGGEWKMASVSGCWTVGTTAGGGRNFPSHGQNPHVPLIVTYDPGGTNVSVTLRQHSPENTLHAIGFHIYKVIGEADCMVISGTVCPVVSCVPHAHSQEVSVQCRLASADYVILPSTYQPDCSAEYTLTIMQKIPR
ncbi:hypothetical protein QTP70_028867 [Hemibagrus guttatus]|uniref:Calpain catalytic domain-containing protein n=1 Tax=Hemibagrus guttatus TaxID=175788 RepID=A0AAE0Q4X4_9TELE|nr:hypothetical protein QTP70_028867 [Hemibagrus guttatus]